MKFVDLVFPGKLHEDLKNSETVEFEFLRAEIEEAWELAPLEIVSRLKTLSNSNYTSYRGIIFELYIMRKLLKAGFSLQYEYSSRGMNSSLDFFAQKDGFSLLVEATCLGPDEQGIRNPTYHLDPEGYKKIRATFRSKLHKVCSPPEFPAILAVCNSFSNFLSSNFEKVQVLYGTPAVRFDLNTNESTLVLSDKGVWAEDVAAVGGYSAAYFTRGAYPGFAYPGQSEIWLNPNGKNELKVGVWPEDVNYFKSVDALFQTSKSSNYEWQPVPSFF